MQVTSITEFRAEPGTYLEFPVSLGRGSASEVRPSFNQSFHLASALNAAGPGPTTVWIAAAFDVAGPVDIDALMWSFGKLIERHSALRTTFHTENEKICRRVHAFEEVLVSNPHAIRIANAAELSAHVRERMNLLCHPQQAPSYSFAAVNRLDRSTIVCGFDHAHVDAVSITVAIEELSSLYSSRTSGSPSKLGTVGSFVDYCALEGEAPTVPVSDPRVRAWADFFGNCGGTTPAFPFDLGVTQGVQAPQATTIHRVCAASATESFEYLCRSQGAGMFSGVAAAMAEASTKIGGPPALSFLFPLHTRREPQWSRALGWFTTNAPMVVTVGTDFSATLASAHSSFRAALPLGTVPIPRLLEAMGDSFARTRQDVFMISYIDYRTLPGASAAERNAHHISNVTSADDAQFWISRTADGLFLRSRFPDTALGHDVIEKFAQTLTTVLETTSAAVPDSCARSLVGPSA